MTVSSNQYYEEKYNFIEKHNKKSECNIYTSPMENNRYHKEYCWKDGAMWCEITELVTEPAVAKVHGLEVIVPVELWKTEFYSTEAPSKYFYER